MSAYDVYQTPLASRYASPEMMALFSARKRASTWRWLWLILAEAQLAVGLPRMTQPAVDDIRAHLDVTDDAFRIIAEEERVRRHDVMSHIYALEREAPAARGLIHVGATSCYVTDNGDLLLMRDGLDLLLPKIARVIHNLARFAVAHRDLPALAFTHYQAAQPITVGRRACQWIQDLVMDLEDVEHVRAGLRFRGAQGATGTQASFLELFGGDGARVDRLNAILCDRAGFPACYDVSTQTYTRKVDLRIGTALAGFGATAVSIATDIRLLAHDKVLDEPHEPTQIGSSAMAFKMNPMRSERVCSLGRKLSHMTNDFADTFSGQWLERTLDDSAIRRMNIPEMFLLADAIAISLDNITAGLVVFPAVLAAQLQEELPFMASENIIMKMVASGESRQEAHERIRVLSLEAVEAVKVRGGANDLVDRIRRTEFFRPIWPELDGMLDPRQFVGRSAEIVDRYAGPGGTVQAKIGKYIGYCESAAAAELKV